jgi:hypothetical protein
MAATRRRCPLAATPRDDRRRGRRPAAPARGRRPSRAGPRRMASRGPAPGHAPGGVLAGRRPFRVGHLRGEVADRLPPDGGLRPGRSLWAAALADMRVNRLATTTPDGVAAGVRGGRGPVLRLLRRVPATLRQITLPSRSDGSRMSPVRRIAGRSRRSRVEDDKRLGKCRDLTRAMPVSEATGRCGRVGLRVGGERLSCLRRSGEVSD